MGTISVSLPSDGSTASVSQYNTPITTIVNAINGNLDSNNIASVSGTKVTTGSLSGASFDSATAGGWNLLSQTFIYGTNNGNKEFTVTTSSDVTGTVSAGMKMKFGRGTSPPTQCMAFVSGSSQYATKSSPTGIAFTTTFTLEAWIYVTSYSGSNAGIVSRYDGTNGFVLYITSAGQLALNAQSTTSQTSYQSVPTGQWVHVAGTFSSGTMNLYMNGTLISSVKSGSATSIIQGGSLQVGAYNTGQYFNGYISEARIWSAAQSQATIQANMAINLTGSETNLVALFKGNGNFNDATSNANNLTATNSAIATQANNPFNTTEYAVVTSASYSAPNTTITLFTGNSNTIPNQTLNSPYYSTTRAPYGFPAYTDNWTVPVIIGARFNNSGGSAGAWSNVGWQISIPTGHWSVSYSVRAAATAASGTTFLGAGTTLSTANNTNSDSRFYSQTPVSSPSITENDAIVAKRASLVLTTQTVYYLNITGQGGTTNGLYVGNDSNSINTDSFLISAECTYL